MMRSFQRVFDYEVCRLRPVFWEWGLAVRFNQASIQLGTFAALVFALVTIATPFLSLVLGEAVAVDPDSAWRWALAGFANLLGIARFVTHQLRPARLALAVKARAPWAPSDYLEM